ncbi:uncharacterized protein [Diadema antillarum]|uniref:uncharacterized protein n=1 Tax=Diadema antillarum TaxID=105358 RepID=UPI003A86B935
MAGRETIDRLRKEHECSICWQKFESARFLACFHSFCELCIERCATTNDRESTVVCPICRQCTRLPGDGVKGLPLNFIMNRMVDAFEEFEAYESRLKSMEAICDWCGDDDAIATSYCHDCRHVLCDDCVTMHAKMKIAMRDHVVTPISDIRSGKTKIQRIDSGPDELPVCQQHEHELLKFYCNTCKRSVCRDCILTSHSKPHHDCMDMASAAIKLRENLRKLLAESRNRATEISDSIYIIDQRRNEAMAEIKRVIERVNQAADDDIKQIEERRQLLINDLKQVQYALEERVEGVRYNVKEAESRLSRVNTIGEIILEKSKDHEMLLLHEGFGSTINKPLSKKFDRAGLDRVLEIARKIRFDRETPKQFIGKVTHAQMVWRLARQVEFPVRRCVMNGMTSYKDGQLVIGYYSGGVDVVSVNGSGRRVVDDVKVHDVAALSDGSFAVSSVDGSLQLLSSDGKVKKRFDTQGASGFASIAVDKDDNILAGYPFMQKVMIFSTSTGSLIRAISTSGCAPWQLHTFKSGHFVVSDPCAQNGPIIRVYDQNGTVKSSIRGGPSEHSYCTTDSDDNLYVAVISKGGEDILSINLMTPEGKFVENVVQNQRLNLVSTWLRLASPSPGTVVVSTHEKLLVYRKRPTYNEFWIPVAQVARF